MSHNHSHHHHGECCSHGASHECCHHEGSCGAHHHDDCSGHHDHDQDNFYSELIEIADEAWMEVLKDKIKDQIAKTGGKHIEELAKLVADANHERWKHKLAKKKGQGEFRNKVRDFFNRGS